MAIVVLGLLVTWAVYFVVASIWTWIVGALGSVLLPMGLSLMESLLSERRATRKESRERHLQDLVSTILMPWKRQLESQNLFLRNSFGSVVGVDNPPISVFTVRLENNPLSMTSGIPRLQDSVLWNKIPGHWPELDGANSDLHASLRELENRIRRFLQGIENALPPDSSTFKWSRDSGSDGRKMRTLDLWNLMLGWVASGIHNRPPLRLATVQKQNDAKWIVELGQGHGVGSGIERDAIAACEALNDATDSTVNKMLLQETLHARRATMQKITALASLIDHAVFSRKLPGACSICKKF
jgi:hypothetical protein